MGEGLVQRNGCPLFRVLQIIVKLYNIWKNLGDGEGGVSLEWMKSGQGSRVQKRPYGRPLNTVPLRVGQKRLMREFDEM